MNIPRNALLLRAFLPALEAMMGGGLICLQNVEVAAYRPGPGQA